MSPRRRTDFRYPDEVKLRIVAALPAALFLLTACSRPTPVIVGSKDTPEQRLLGEIVAQHLEQRLGTAIQRRLGLGDTAVVHQALINGDVGLYPEYSGIIVTELLKEPPSRDAEVTLERARLEVRRISQLEFLGLLGFDAPTALVISATEHPGIHSATEAAASPNRWKVGLTYEFQAFAAGLPSLKTYRFDMGAPLRSMRYEEMFPALRKGEVNMVVATLSDGHLTQDTFRALADDQQAFTPAAAGILVRAELLATEPGLQAALQSLSGKITLETMRRLNAQVQIEERAEADVAAEFLKSAGLP